MDVIMYEENWCGGLRYSKRCESHLPIVTVLLRKPIQKPGMARSLALLSIDTSPSFRNTFRYFSGFSA